MDFNPFEWEFFYTEAKSGKENAIDQIGINPSKKIYRLEIQADEENTEFYDNNDFPTYSKYVSRETFELLLNSIKRDKYVLFEGRLNNLSYKKNEREK